MGEETITEEYMEWLKENLKQNNTNLQEFILSVGTEGLLASFETWLFGADYLKDMEVIIELRKG